MSLLNCSLLEVHS